MLVLRYTLSYTIGHCKCPNIPCISGQTCINGQCLNLQDIKDDQLIDAAFELIKKQKHEQALKILEKILQQSNQNSNIYYLAALASFGLEKHKQSLRYIKKAISLNSVIPEYYIIRGRAFIQTKQFDEAQKQFQKVLDLGFDDLGLVSFYQAQVLLNDKRHEQAIKKFQQALQAHPQKTQWYVRKAMAHAINKEYKMSLLTCRQGLKIDPKNEQIRLFMKQFLNIDEGKQLDIERAQEMNEQLGTGTKQMNQEEIDEMLKQRLEEEEDQKLQFDMKRNEQKKQKNIEKQKKKKQSAEANQKQQTLDL